MSDEVRPVMKDMARPRSLIEFATSNRLPFAMLLNPAILNEVGWGGPTFRSPGERTSGDGGAILIALDDDTYSALGRRNEPPQVGMDALDVVLSFGDRLMRCSIPFRALYQVVFVFDLEDSANLSTPLGGQSGLRLVVDNTRQEEDIDA
jgi:hypothetical protein